MSPVLLRVWSAFVITSSLLILGPVDSVRAVEFAIVGARAAGMGGAGVAVTSNSLATYWNPAGLAMEHSVDIHLQATGQLADQLGVIDTLQDIDSIDTSDASPANQARLQSLLNRLNQPGASVSGVGAAGLYFKGYLGNHYFGMNISDVATAGAYTSTPLTAGVSGSSLVVNGTMSLPALEARQVVLSYAHAFADQKFALGVSGKIIQGAAYSGSLNVLTADGDVKFRDDLGQANTSLDFGVDVGAIARPWSWLRVALVGKDLNGPSFTAPDGSTYRLDPQFRGGIAVNPWSSMTLTLDGDILPNKTLVPGVKSQVLGLGAEQTLFSEGLALRLGTQTDLESLDQQWTYTAGLGVRVWAVRFDLAGGYDFDQQNALVSGSLAATF